MGVYSNYVVTESGIYSPSAMNAGGSNALDLMIECAQDDMKMFDSVIELDFMHAYAEAGMVSITEADDEKAGKGIIRKIKDLFDKIVKKIKQFISTFIAKLQNLFHNDANLYKEYIKDFANAEGVKLDSYTKIYPLSKVKSGIQEAIGSISHEFDMVFSTIEAASSEDAISKALDLMSEDKLVKKMKKSASDVDSIFFNTAVGKQEDYVLGSSDIDAINSVMGNGGKRVMDIVKTEGKNLEKMIADAKKECKLQKYDSGYAEDGKDKDLFVARINAFYKVCNKFGSVASKFTSASCNACSRYIAAARRAFVSASKKASSKKNEAAIDNDMYAYVLGEASDIYMESALSMI